MKFSSGVNEEVFQIVSIGLAAAVLLIFLAVLVKRFRKKKDGRKASVESDGLPKEETADPLETLPDTPEQHTQMAAQLAHRTKEIRSLQAKCECLEKELVELRSQQQGRIIRAKATCTVLDERKRILVVEDNEKTRMEAVDILRKLDYKVETSANGYIALQMLRKSAPKYYDLILMDAIMEDMDGYETALKIRQMDRTDLRLLPIVTMSANTFEREACLAKEAHIDGTIAKPLNAQQMERTVRKFLPFDAETFNYII